MATAKESKLCLKGSGCEVWNNYISKITVNSILKKIDYFFDNNVLKKK